MLWTPKAIIKRLLKYPVLPTGTNPVSDYELAHKLYVDTAVNTGVGNVLYLPVSQCVQSGPVDGNNSPACLGTGSGLLPQLLGGTTPVRVAFSAGYGSTGAASFLETISTNQSFPAVTASNTSYLTVERTGAGAVTLASTVVPAQYGKVFDNTLHSLLDFEGANNATTVTDAFSHSWTFVGNAKLTTTSPILGTSSLILDGSGDCIYTNAITSFRNGIFTLEFTVRFNTLPSSGNSVGLVYARNGSGFGFKIDLLNTTGTRRLNIDMSSNGTTNNIANSQNGTNTTWNTGQDYKIAVTWDGTTYRYFVDGAVDYSTANSNPICPITELIIGAKTTAASGSVDGKFDNFRMTIGASRYNAAYTAGSTQFVPDALWYDTVARRMKSGSPTAITSGGGWTNKNLVVVGQCVAGGSTISSVNPAPYNGYYDSGWTAISGSTTYPTSHYFGHNLYDASVTLRNSTYPDFGKELQTDETNGGYNMHKGPVAHVTRIQTLATGDDYTRVIDATGTTVAVAMDQMRVELKRNF